ncbi:MAG: VWA domain-containing protein [Clostridiales bacterium]|jgi:Ca-activated chloride channel family protein|nr:VWA domain-containing protein [Clostridiales bacterium]
MKRVTAILVSLALSFSTLAGCAAESPNASPPLQLESGAETGEIAIGETAIDENAIDENAAIENETGDAATNETVAIETETGDAELNETATTETGETALSEPEKSAYTEAARAASEAGESAPKPLPNENENRFIVGDEGSVFDSLPSSVAQIGSVAGFGVADIDTWTPPAGSEDYLEIVENKQISVLENPMQTFSLKIDTASYRNVARYIRNGFYPSKDAVRVEEMINYFTYDEPLEATVSPFAIYAELGPSIFDSGKQLAFIRLKSRSIDRSGSRSNLTFLIDSSGSMDSPDKLPLLQSSFKLLVDNLTENDVVSIVTYAGSSEVVLDSVSGNQKDTLMNGIDNIFAGGSTAGADGIQTAYSLAAKNFIPNGNNRVILATDGDFNVGISMISELEEFISEKRGTGVYLSVLGFGTGNLKDSTMETLAKNGNGNYSYIDSIDEAQKVLVDELATTLFTVADDVKAQLEFNPAKVKSYRRIGYENRSLANEDFENDAKDAGEIGAGTDVIMLYELELEQSTSSSALTPEAPASEELFEVRIRYKNTGEGASQLMSFPVNEDKILGTNTSDFKFASSVAGFGALLRSSEYLGKVTIDDIANLASSSKGLDSAGYRLEFCDLVDLSRSLEDDVNEAPYLR